MDKIQKPHLIGLKLKFFLFVGNYIERRGHVVYIEYQSVVPSSELGPPTPSTASECASPLDPGGQHSLADEGVCGPNSDEWTDNLYTL